MYRTCGVSYFPMKPMNHSDIFDLSNCTLCPRNCHADRLAGNTGFCRETAEIRGARAALLAWEEPCLTGTKGSGAVFFSGCNLGCVFCQNYCLASSQAGRPLSPERLADIFLSLESEGAANINLVTPAHFSPLLVPVLEEAKKRGLRIPVVYNTGSYEKAEAIRRLDGLIDIYLPDLKYVSDELAVRYSRAPRYFAFASAAIREMVRQCPEPCFSDGSHALDAPEGEETPLMLRGVIVRHLALPGQQNDSRAVLRYLHETYGDKIFISIMSQYTPMSQVQGDPLLSRRLTEEEYDALTDYAVELGIDNGFLQEGETASESFIPAFDGTGL